MADVYRELVLAQHIPGLSERPEELIGKRIIKWAESIPVASTEDNAVVTVLIENFNTPPELVMEVLNRTCEGESPFEVMNEHLRDSSDPHDILNAYNDFIRAQMKGLEEAQKYLATKNYKLAVMLEHMATPKERISAHMDIDEYNTLRQRFLELCGENKFDEAKQAYNEMMRIFAEFNIQRDESNANIFLQIELRNPNVKAIFSQFGAMHKYFAMKLGNIFDSIQLHDPNTTNLNGQDKMLGFIIGEYATSNADVKRLTIPEEFLVKSMLEQYIYEKLTIDKPFGGEDSNLYNWAAKVAEQIVSKRLQNFQNLRSEALSLLSELNSEGVEAYLKQQGLINS